MTARTYLVLTIVAMVMAGATGAGIRGLVGVTVPRSFWLVAQSGLGWCF